MENALIKYAQIQLHTLIKYAQMETTLIKYALLVLFYNNENVTFYIFSDWEMVS